MGKHIRTVISIAGSAFLATTLLQTFQSPSMGAPPDGKGPDEVGRPVRPVEATIDMSKLPAATAATAPAPGLSDKSVQTTEPSASDQGDALESTFAAQAEGAATVDEAFTTAAPNFAGIGNVANPPDPNIDVGPNHVVQMVNTSFQIWDKAGTPLLGPTATNQLWVAANAGNICRLNNSGDPVVVYDHLADRWVLTQFAIPNGFQGDPTGFCVAVSQTADPTDGQWYLYEFPFSNTDADPNPQVNFDYPKISVWPDAFYVSSQQGYPGGTIDVWAYDRVNMLNGNPATYQRFNLGAPALVVLPSDLDGTAPAAGTPAVFARAVDGDIWGAATGDNSDRVELFELETDWSNPANSTLTTLPDLPAMAFDSGLCTDGSLMDNCVPQPGVGSPTRATLPNWPMFRLQFRQFSGYQSLVFNHTVDADGTGHAGIRWYELRRPSGGAWGIRQQGTYSPDAGNPGLADDVHRWMGSVAMDKRGNLALGYSASSGTVSPEIRYTGRKAGDPLGLMSAPETTLVTGSGFINNSRSGDYSSMVVDPVDDCTFWYTTEYSTATLGRETRIGAFKFSDCNRSDLSVTKTDRTDAVNAGDQLIYDVTVTNDGPDPAYDVEVVDTLPLGIDYVTDTDSCTLSGGTGPNGEDQLTCDVGDIPVGGSETFSIKTAVPADFVETTGPTGISNRVSVSSPWFDPDLSNNTDTEGTIVEDSADLEVTKICKPDQELPAGETGFCDIFVDNHGPSSARDVELLDEISSDTELVSLTATSTAGSCAASLVNTRVSCTLGDISAQDRVTVHVEFSANEPGDVNDVATVSSATPDPDVGNNKATESVTVAGISDLAITKSDSPDPVIAGELLTYTLTMTNEGPSTALNARISDVLSSEVEVVSVNADGGGSCNAGTPGDALLPTYCTFDSVAPSGGGDNTREMTIVVRILPDVRGLIHNDARATNDHFDPDNSDDVATQATLVQGQADLSVSKEDFPDPVLAGNPLSYQLTLTNNGPSSARGVVVEDALPDGVVFGSATVANDLGVCALLDTPPNTVSCELGTVMPNADEPIVITVAGTVRPDVPDGTTLTNTGSVTSTTTDPDLSDNSASEDTSVQAVADLLMLKGSDKDVYNPSEHIVYTLSVTNGGPSDAQDVVVTDTLPLSDKKVTYVFDSGGCTYAPSPAHTVTCDLGTVAAGDTETVDVTITVKGGVGDVLNSATVVSSTTDPDPASNTALRSVLVSGGKGNKN